MSANQMQPIQDQIAELFRRTQELAQKVDSQQQTITFLWIAVGILGVISIVALGLALWQRGKNRNRITTETEEIRFSLK